MPVQDKKLKIGIAGCGSIGSSLAKVILRDFSGQAALSGLYDIDPRKSGALSARLKKDLALYRLEDLITKSDLIIEAAYGPAAFDIAKKAILGSCDVLVMSVGGIVRRCGELESLAGRKRVNIFIPSGAICGVDGLKASACGKIKRVTLTTRKPPRAFSSVAYVMKKKIPLDKMTRETLIFKGSALAACRFFPQNINVAATLSLAGIGLNRTRVRIFASPGLKRNMHEVEIDSDAGRIFTRTENTIHPANPKTSYLAVLSAVAVLKQVLRRLKLGA